ncbi:MAG TPA: hypothetical protein DCS07_13155 [Bdellovibrionales bacterium]|nr:MAG: hypothetical protein A2Z97_14040 [Bdellovibrionales bacterium GWB1_52_6]OFZ06481.1 MAG: hypothetical protein A2X97_16810 [Bdellovibrionales bacterium GWA1_52_35]OFZ33101.1 MAG: hypothetical protein A2070_10070 [Bdellovibrionales bacterium GWC1_52_8]HAR43554.1 hypothetical protein [Bdellovibrionales bacterium]HCM39484.1 hypothetical protein [Bdellovibrionales bacterium]
MDFAVEYLLSFLQDEFRNEPEIRIRVHQRSVTLRSPDLLQDYDPETSNLHTLTGVDVRVRSREYFFPSEWAQGPARRNVDQLVLEIREFLQREA